MPNIGDRVRCRPAKGEAVQRGPGLAGQFLPEDGAEVIWTPYHQQRLQDGSIVLEASYYHAERLQRRLSFLDGEMAACQDEKQAGLKEKLTAQREQCLEELDALQRQKQDSAKAEAVADQKEDA